MLVFWAYSFQSVYRFRLESNIYLKTGLNRPVYEGPNWIKRYFYQLGSHLNLGQKYWFLFMQSVAVIVCLVLLGDILLIVALLIRQVFHCNQISKRDVARSKQVPLRTPIALPETGVFTSSGRTVFFNQHLPLIPHNVNFIRKKNTQKLYSHSRFLH